MSEENSTEQAIQQELLNHIKDSYYYDNQIKSYILQFMAIFDDMYVKTGKTSKRDAGYIPVPIIIGDMDRVAAAAATGHTQNKHIRLPMMSVEAGELDYAEHRAKGRGVQSGRVYTPIGGTPQQDGQVHYKKTPTPWDIGAQLHIYTSNVDQMMQILEQILILFDPDLSIQKSDSPLDMSRLFDVKLRNISIGTNVPVGVEPRMVVYTLSFVMQCWISIPDIVKNNIVNKVQARVAMVSDGKIGTLFSSGENNKDIGTLFDELNIETMELATGTLPE